MKDFSYYKGIFENLNIMQVAWLLLFFASILALLGYCYYKEKDTLNKKIIGKISKVSILKEYDDPYFFPIFLPKVDFSGIITYDLSDYPDKYFEPKRMVKVIVEINYKDGICYLTVKEPKSDFEKRDLSIGTTIIADCVQKNSTSKSFKTKNLISLKVI